MSNNSKIVIAAIIIIIAGAFIYHKTKLAPVTPPPASEQTSILGCYVATLAKDVYTLKIDDALNGGFAGKLSFKNFEKDSSSGTYVGTYKNGILLGDYSFQSEGSSSVMQVIFKKSGDSFVRGYGDTDATGTHFTDLSKITYDNSAVFKPTNCTE